jgi:hypothetical protein
MLLAWIEAMTVVLTLCQPTDTDRFVVVDDTPTSWSGAASRRSRIESHL